MADNKATSPGTKTKLAEDAAPGGRNGDKDEVLRRLELLLQRIEPDDQSGADAETLFGQISNTLHAPFKAENGVDALGINSLTWGFGPVDVESGSGDFTQGGPTNV